MRAQAKKGTLYRQIMRHWQLYIIFAVPLTIILLFSYKPMYGILIAFKNFVATKGILGSDWADPWYKYFQMFLVTKNFPRLMWNTISISLYGLIAGFPIPIILAISLNECRNLKLKKSVQMITYAPHFISVVIIVSILSLVMAPKTGILNNAIAALGGDRIDFFAKPEYFKSIYVWSGIWQGMGFSSVIYMAALAGVDPGLHEAATVDGASRLQRIFHVDLPGIAPTIIITLILNMGSIMSVGYEKILLMQNSLNMSASDVISTYVYKIGLENAQYSLSTAVGLFNSLINIVLLVSVNRIARKVSETSLW